MSTITTITSALRHLTGATTRTWSRHAATGGGIAMLCYHRIGTAPDCCRLGLPLYNVEKGLDAELFESQIAYCAKHFRPADPARIEDGMLPERGFDFMVSFDDGTRDGLEVAAPILERHGVPAVFFVCTEHLGNDRPFWWETLGDLLRATDVPSLVVADIPGMADIYEGPDSLPLYRTAQREFAHAMLGIAMARAHPDAIPELLETVRTCLEVGPPPPGRNVPLLDWDDCRALQERGFLIGGHTARHANCARVRGELDLRIEIDASLDRLERELGRPTRLFAYPYGKREHLDDRVRARIAERGIRLAFTTERGIGNTRQDPLTLPRVLLHRRWQLAWTHQIDRAVSASGPFATLPEAAER